MASTNNNHRPASSQTDIRLYVPGTESWDVGIHTGGSATEYCSSKHPGEDFFHMLMRGEIYLQSGDEKYCLNCAQRHGVLTRDRMFWQRAHD